MQFVLILKDLNNLYRQMQKSTYLLGGLLCLLINVLSAQIESSFDFATEGKRVCLVDVIVDLNSLSATLNFRDAALNTTDEISVYRRPLYGSGDDWILQVTGLTPGTNSWTDTNVNSGERWEYQVRRQHNNGEAIGYAVASLRYDQSDYRGQMILVVSDDYASDLSEKILRLKKDLTADGWYVNQLVVAKGNINFFDEDRVVDVKNSITEIYNNAPSDDKPKVLFLLGSVPLPRGGQGLQAPDGHIESTGARGSDTYYADIDGIFTDTATYDIPEQTVDIIKNFPGDNRWDQDKIPSELEMAFGRVSFLRVTSGVYSEELIMMERYLDRLHDYRYVMGGEKMGTRTAFNENGYSNSTDASYRCLPALSGGENISQSNMSASEGHNEWVADNGPFILYMSNQWIPELPGWENFGMDALVYSSDQSNFGYGDIPNNSVDNPWQASTIRRILSYESKCLIALWTTSAVNVFHQAGVGEPLGYACKFVMDHHTDNQNYKKKIPQNWDEPDWWNRTHFNFFGDPTLRLYQTIPATNLAIANTTNVFKINWTASVDDHLVGYHVYKSDEEFGIYQKISGETPITETDFTDPFYQEGDWYMVRAIAEQTSGSGIFLNPSQGIFVEGDLVLSAKENEINATVSIFPNPTENHFSISSDAQIDQLEIWDIRGKLMLSVNAASLNNQIIDINHLPKGSYLVVLYSGEKSKKEMVVKI